MNTYTIDNKGWFPENHQGQQGDERVRGLMEVSGGARNFYHQWWGIAWPSAVLRKPPGKYLTGYESLFCPGLLNDPTAMLGSSFWRGSMEDALCIQGKCKADSSEWRCPAECTDNKSPATVAVSRTSGAPSRKLRSAMSWRCR